MFDQEKEEPDYGAEGLEPLEDDELDEDERKIDDGEVCGSCGGTFAKEQGEAALCKTCWDGTATPADREGFILADCGLID